MALFRRFGRGRNQEEPQTPPDGVPEVDGRAGRSIRGRDQRETRLRAVRRAGSPDRDRGRADRGPARSARRGPRRHLGAHPGRGAVGGPALRAARDRRDHGARAGPRALEAGVGGCDERDRGPSALGRGHAPRAPRPAPARRPRPRSSSRHGCARPRARRRRLRPTRRRSSSGACRRPRRARPSPSVRPRARRRSNSGCARRPSAAAREAVGAAEARLRDAEERAAKAEQRAAGAEAARPRRRGAGRRARRPRTSSACATRRHARERRRRTPSG